MEFSVTVKTYINTKEIKFYTPTMFLSRITPLLFPKCDFCLLEIHDSEIHSVLFLLRGAGCFTYFNLFFTYD